MALKGGLNDADIENLFGLMEAEATLHEKFNIIIIFYEADAVEWSALLKPDAMSMSNELREKIDHYAIVGGPNWLALATSFLRPFMAANFKWFSSDDIESAWDFVESRPSDSPQ